MSEQDQLPVVFSEQILDLNAAVAIQQAYLAACQALLDDSDYAVIRGEKFRKRSGWAKLRRAFAITTQAIREERVVLDDDWGYVFVIRAMMPNGRFEDADGSCMASELVNSNIKPTLPNVRAKALTRGKSRATSDLLGAGVVSADEMGDENEAAPKREAAPKHKAAPVKPDSAKHWIEHDNVRKRFWSWCKSELGLDEDSVHAMLGVAHVSDFAGTMADAAARIKAAMDEIEHDADALGTAGEAELEF